MAPELLTLGRYLAGEFDNQAQSLALPVWYVHVRLWLRPVKLFDDSITLFAEQASAVNIDRPYRPRLLRLVQDNNGAILVQHYMFPDIKRVAGAARDTNLLSRIATDNIEFLPTCNLNVSVDRTEGGYRYTATPENDRPCQFTYENQTYNVSLGFEVTPDTLKTFDRGIDPVTGKSIWGAIMGPYEYTKIGDYSAELR